MQPTEFQLNERTAHDHGAQRLEVFWGQDLMEQSRRRLHAGQFYSPAGPSGSGKSTLLNCIGALEKPDSGSIEVNGADITAMSGRQRRLYRLNRVGYLFQDYALVPDRSVNYNVRLAIPRAMPRAARRAAIDSALESVGLGVGVSGFASKKVHTLSGGEQQRVALARLLVKDPDIVLADEPTGALDADNAEMVVRHLRGFAQREAVVIVATHSATIAAQADRCLELPSAPR